MCVRFDGQTGADVVVAAKSTARIVHDSESATGAGLATSPGRRATSCTLGKALQHVRATPCRRRLKFSQLFRAPI